MRVLVDANLLIEPTRPAPDSKVVAWLADHEDDLVVDAIVLGELALGVQSLPGGRRREALQRWFDELAGALVVLPWDAAVAKTWARLVASLRRKGKPVPVLDGMIAASALHHGLAVATRNTRGFRETGVRLIDPYR